MIGNEAGHIKRTFVFFALSNLPGRKNQYIISLSIISLVSAVCFLFSGLIDSQVVAFILFVTLSFIAMVFDIFPVLLSALMSALIWDYFFLQPRFNLRVGNTEDKILLSMYFLIASLNAVFTFKLRKMEQLAVQKKEKEQSLKLYNTLFNSLSHEFRTPIAVIMGNSDMLMDMSAAISAEEKEKMLLAISVASIRLNQQVENLLNMSRLESGFLKPKRDWCDIAEIINTVIVRLNEALKHFKLEVIAEEDMPLVKLDYRLMEQVLYNLIYNATQYIPSSSLIRIKAKYIGEELQITVMDNGQGFPEAEMDKVFEKFYRLKHTKKEGTGLGLSIVKGFVEAHNGTIELKNNKYGGASFIIRLPAEKYHLEQITI